MIGIVRISVICMEDDGDYFGVDADTQFEANDEDVMGALFSSVEAIAETSEAASEKMGEALALRLADRVIPEDEAEEATSETESDHDVPGHFNLNDIVVVNLSDIMPDESAEELTGSIAQMLSAGRNIQE